MNKGNTISYAIIFEAILFHRVNQLLPYFHPLLAHQLVQVVREGLVSQVIHPFQLVQEIPLVPKIVKNVYHVYYFYTHSSPKHSDLPFHLSLLVSLVHQEDLVYLVDLADLRFPNFLVVLCHLEVPLDRVVQIDLSSQAYPF